VSVNELRIHQDALQRHLDPAVELAAVAAPALVELHQRTDVFLAVVAAIGPACERGDDALRARVLVRLADRLADENLLARRRALGLACVERPLDPDTADMRIEREARQTAGLDRAALEIVIQIE